jgi:lysophospholipase L1-like esterase
MSNSTILSLVTSFAWTLCFALPHSLVAQQLPESAAADEQLPAVVEKFQAEATEKWESEIKKLEARDQAESDPESAILFIGSSSIRMWETIEQDIAPYKPIRRGYGGAKFSDVAVYAKRLICPHQYRALAIFVGNDVAGKPDDHSVADIEALVRHILKVAAEHSPETPMFLIEVTPTPQRFAAWSKIRQANAALREISLTTPHTYFIPTAESYLDESKQPRADLFRDDGLHQNQAGYELWATLIKRRFGEVLK